MYIMSNLTQFKNKQNLVLLWNIILDELHINTSNKNLMSNINAIFEGNINPFVARANKNITLMELNKLFLSQVVLAVNRLFPNFTQEQNIKRITISDEEISEPYKVEDIHASRQNDFEKEVERKQMDLDTYMTPKKPRDLDFSDKQTDLKIKSMDSLIAQKMAQRNMEIDQLQNNAYNSSIDPEKWLTPKETSVKNEKNVDVKENIKLKVIDFNDNQETNNQKKVSWNDDEPTLNIFNKLKKQSTITETLDLNDELYSNENQYVEQKSILLPDVKQEEINRIQATMSTMNDPILPKTEIVKQLNEMNKKIDNIYELIFKLTNQLNTNQLNTNQLNTNQLNTNQLNTDENITLLVDEQESIEI